VEWTTQVKNVGKIPAWRVQKPDGESVWFYSIDSLASFVEEKEAEQPDNLYYGREGVEQNFKEAAKLYRMAAEQGDAHSQVSLGFMYANGEGVEQSHKEAIKWYRKAAEQGDEDAIVALEELPQ
jgi:TPR repeat protein